WITNEPDTRGFGMGTREVLIVDAVNAEAHTIGVSALKPRDAGNLPAVENRARQLIILAQTPGDVRQLIDVVDREVVTPIESGRTIIGQTSIAVDSDEVAVVGHSGQRFAPGVGQAEEQSSGKTAIQPDLQGIVIRCPAHLVQRDRAEALI